MSDSLLAPANQPDLLPKAADSFFAELEGQGEFTGERLFQRRPDTYKAVVVLLAQKMGVIKIGKLLGVSPNTVLAVRDREGGSIDIVKEHLAHIAHAGATLASEGILNALNDILQRRACLGVKDLKDMAVVYGILVQNGQLLAGQPTARLEVHELKKPGHEDFNAYIHNLPQAQVTHLEAGTPGQKGAEKTEKAGGPQTEPTEAQTAPGAAGQATEPASEARRTDECSDVNPSKP